MEILEQKREVKVLFTEEDMKSILEFMNDKSKDIRLFGVGSTPLGKLLDLFESELKSKTIPHLTTSSYL